MRLEATTVPPPPLAPTKLYFSPMTLCTKASTLICIFLLAVSCTTKNPSNTNLPSTAKMPLDKATVVLAGVGYIASCDDLKRRRRPPTSSTTFQAPYSSAILHIRTALTSSLSNATAQLGAHSKRGPVLRREITSGSPLAEFAGEVATNPVCC